MTIETDVPHTRRAILAAALGGVAATVASAIGRPLSVRAADGQTVVVGGEYDSSSPTYIANGSSGDVGIAIWGASPASVGVYGSSTNSTGVVGESNSGTGVRGYGPIAIRGEGTQTGVRGDGASIGVQGVTSSGTGVEGFSSSSFGVYGNSSTGVGVRASGGAGGLLASSVNGPAVEGATTSASGVIGKSLSGTGLLGVAGDTVPPTKPKTGVYGHSSVDANSRGVWGYSPAGQGVRGEATTGRGVHGQASSGLGVRGSATSGVGLSGEATTGYALRTKGRVRLDNSSGIATIASGTSSIVVTPGVDLTATSAVIATLNGDAGGATTVKRIAINSTANTFTIYLTANATASVKLAWLVLG